MNEERPGAGDGTPLREGAQPPIRFFNLKPKDMRAAGWLLALLAAGVVLLTVHPGASAPALARPAVSTAGATGSATAAASLTAADPLLAEEQAIDSRLQTILARVAGVGTVSVEVDLVEGPATDYAVNSQVTDSTSTQPTGAGAQTSTQHSADGQVVLSGAGQPAVHAIRGPVVDGVLVVAVGATSPVVEEEITQAVQAATGVPAYRIVVLPAAGGN